MKLKHYWKKAICVGTAVVLALGMPGASIPVYAVDADVVVSAPEIDVSDVAENETEVDISEDTYEFANSAIDPNDEHDQNLIDNNDQIVEDAEADIDTEVAEDDYLVDDQSAEDSIIVDTVADDSIGEELVGASYTSGQWTYTISNFESEITAYSGNSGNVSIPSSLGGYPVTVIGSYVFEGKAITGITIPSTIETIKYGAFNECKYLTAINYNAKKSTLWTSSGGPFLNAGKNSGGVTVTFGSGVTVIPDSIFDSYNNDNRPRIKSVTIPSSVTEIGGNAFEGCSELTSVSMGSGIVTIGSYAFSGTGIKTITIPSKVELIKYGAFNDCKYLKTIKYNAKKSSVWTSSGGPFLNAGKNSGGVTVTFGSGVTVIPDSIFDSYNNDNRPRIKSVTIPSSVTGIGGNAFEGCSELTSVSMGSGIVTIGSYAFNGTGIKTITIPSKVELIKYGAFNDCKYLTSINYNAKKSSVWTSSGGPFLNAGKESSGVTVTFGSGVTNIPKYIFDAYNTDDRPRLKSVSISSSVQTIEDYAFEGSDITSISIPASVTSINYYSFANCSKLATVKIYNKNATINRYAFDGCPSNIRFYIYKNGTVDTYVKDRGFKRTYLDSSIRFTDVQDPNHAYYKAIYWAANAGITKGYPDGTFGINRNCTRGEMMMFLWRYVGKPAPKTVSKSPFKDVLASHSYYKAILWGAQKGITKGYPDGTFGINRNVSRGECMMFLWRLKGKPAPKNVAVSPFKDVPKSHAYYNAILWGYQNKITNGYTSGTKKGQFGINESCTRGAIVTFLYRAR